MTTPILIIAYKRPETTIIALNAISKVQPKKLYVNLNIPSSNASLEEIERCKSVEEIFQNIHWDCNVVVNKWDEHKTAGESIYGAISWVLEHEDRVIVIEDDIVAAPSFFSFAEDLLERYKNDDRIAMISANNYTPFHHNDGDYIFTKYGHIWGWATWKRVWDKFDCNLPYLEDDINDKYLQNIGLSKYEFNYFYNYSKHLLILIHENSINTWDTQFAYFRIRNNMLSIAPRVNLASNIGTTSSRTNLTSDIKTLFYPVDTEYALQKHPNVVECHYEYDKHHFRYHINRKKQLSKRIIDLLERVYCKALRVINGF